MSTATTPTATTRPAQAHSDGFLPPAPATHYARVDSPIGELLLRGDGHALCGLHMVGRAPDAPGPAHRHAEPDVSDLTRDPDAFAAAREQLDAYFAGERTAFDLPLAPHGTPFQLAVWHALCDIPYGETASYGEIAAAVGRPSASRAVGAANGRNPVAVIVPCHRVIGAGGALVGFGGGLDRKRTLLALESSVARDR